MLLKEMSFIVIPEFVAETCVSFIVQGIFTENKIPKEQGKKKKNEFHCN